jgi:hypothetical protein
MRQKLFSLFPWYALFPCVAYRENYGLATNRLRDVGYSVFAFSLGFEDFPFSNSSFLCWLMYPDMPLFFCPGGMHKGIENCNNRPSVRTAKNFMLT